jgi:hypothetical protein
VIDGSSFLAEDEEKSERVNEEKRRTLAKHSLMPGEKDSF